MEGKVKVVEHIKLRTCHIFCVNEKYQKRVFIYG
jgi:hypothetical protein